MRRVSILNSIKDLQIEYATDHAGLSIRDFLMRVKGFTDRQYRHILENAPALNWKIRREEIQNQVSVEKIRNRVDEIAQTHIHYVTASKIGLSRSLKALSDEKNPLKPIDLLNCMKTIETSQKIFHAAMGIPDGNGMIQIYNQLNVVSPTPAPQTKTIPLDPEVERQLTYDDIQELIIIKREQRKMAVVG